MDIESYLETKRKLYGFDFIALYDDKTGEVQLAGKGFEDVNREELTENDVFGQELEKDIVRPVWKRNEWSMP